MASTPAESKQGRVAGWTVALLHVPSNGDPGLAADGCCVPLVEASACRRVRRVCEGEKEEMVRLSGRESIKIN